jgi:hypothetical protein
MKVEAFLTLALPLIGALLAVGSVLWIKATRRVKAPPGAGRDPVRSIGRQDDIANVVPVRPVTAAQLDRWRRRYLYACALAGAALAAYALWLSFGSTA